MRYTIKEGPNAGKRINVPEQEIEQALREGLSRPEAIERYLSDEGLLVDPIVEELTGKAKESGTRAEATGERKARKAPERKPDEIKRAVVAALAEFISGQDGVTGTAVTNVERQVAFELAGDKYELTLVKKRKPKE